jgi:predicted MFS family arabinose efflux permease
VLADRNRGSSYLIMLILGTAMFGMFFFLTIFVQEVWGYSALRTGLAYLPIMGAVMVMAAVSAQLVPRIGARPPMLAGTLTTMGGMLWLSRLSEHSTDLNGLSGPMIVTAVGLGMLFMPITLVALNRVRSDDAGAASSLLNTGQQVGGSIGLAVLGTIAWTAVADSVRAQMTAAMAAAARAGHPVQLPPGQSAGAPAVPPAIMHHALAVGFSRGFVVSAALALLGFVVTLLTIRVKRAELAGADGSPTPAVHAG